MTSLGLAGPAVTIVEVGPRDGLQNETFPVSLDAKIAFVDALATTGISHIETGSFVNPVAVPQMADTDHLFSEITRSPNVRYSALVPNLRGYDRARAVGVNSIALFAAATEAFSQANLKCSVEESFERFAPVVKRGKRDGCWIRGYVSVAFECPFSGSVSASAACSIGERLLSMGCDEISFADTIGRATPDAVLNLCVAAQRSIPVEKTALHFHDTYSRALENVDAGYADGVRIFDSAAGGLGGCPFAPGAAGNLATEVLVAHFDSLGVETGVNPVAIGAAFDLLGIARRFPNMARSR